MPVRILIVDDHGVLRAGLCALLSAEPELDVVGETGNGNEVAALAAALQPDVVLMDLSMPGLGGIETTQHLVASGSTARVLILTVHEDTALLREALRVGAAGYILKRAVGTELIDAIRAVARGELYIHPGMIRALLPQAAAKPAPHEGQRESPTSRELEVLRLIAAGHTNRQVAELLTLSIRTIESHRANLMDKLGLHSRVELVRYAAEHGLLNPDPGPPGADPSGPWVSTADPALSSR